MYTIAIVGKPNVGKTTFINKIMNKRVAIVYDEPGVTRDRQYIYYDNKGLKMNIIDTPGVDKEIKTEMQKKMHQQTDYAIQEAHLCIFIVDAKGVIDQKDLEVANLLRKNKKKVLLMVNKCDNQNVFGDTEEIFRLGFSDVVFASSEHKIGFDKIFAKIKEDYKNYEDIFSHEEREKRIRVSIVGKPNAGKSTFVNAILKEDRCVVSDVSGTTRDSINIDYDLKGHKITIVDTAGIRKKSQITEQLEEKMIFDSIDAIRMCDVCIVLIDSLEGISSQDLHLIDLALKEGRIPVVCFNKIDAVDDPKDFMKRNVAYLGQTLHNIFSPVVFSLSAKNDKDLDTILLECVEMYNKFIFMHKTSYLNKCLEKFKEQAKSYYYRNSEIKFKYIAQIKAKPPYFLVSSNFEEENIKPDYIQNFKKFLVDFLKLEGIPIRLKISKSDNPYAKGKNS